MDTGKVGDHRITAGAILICRSWLKGLLCLVEREHSVSFSGRIQRSKEMMRLLIWLAICTIFTRAQNVNFSLPHPSCNNGASMGIQCDKDAHDINDSDTSDNELEGIQLTTDSKQVSNDASRGYVFYQTRVQMRDNRTGQAASFSTSFSFRIIPDSNNSEHPGDGMAFVMYANGSYRGDAGGTLGVYNRTDLTYLPGTQGTKTFCVEYDTFLNPGLDPSDNHVGVDLENITSKVTAEASSVGLNLKGGYPITTWIDYDFTRLHLEVRVANSSQVRPFDPLIGYTLDLSKVVDEFMSVGLAASTGGSVEFHELLNWTFASFGLPQRKSHGTVSIGMIAGIAVAGVAALMLLGFGCYFWYVQRLRRRRNGERSNNFQYELSVVDMPFRFTYKQLSVATNAFSEASKLGQGGSGSVYRGKISSTGTWVAVKKVANRQERGEKEFLREISVLSQLRHRNLVKLLGFCSNRERGNYLIVYELMPRGSLDKSLYTDSDDVLSWAPRFAIVRGVAAGLAYLHVGTSKQVIHRDIKSSNVMLDEDFSVKVGDFGLARMIDHLTNTSTQLAGTFGYIAPEAVTGKCTDKSDVYAFGALILEIASARRPIDSSRARDEMVLVDWVWTCHMRGRILSVADPRLGGNFSIKEMTMLLKLGLLCSHPDPENRPSMMDVELILAGRILLPYVPLAKPIIQASEMSMEQIFRETMRGYNQHRSTSSGSNVSASTFSRSTGSTSAGSSHSSTNFLIKHK